MSIERVLVLPGYDQGRRDFLGLDLFARRLRRDGGQPPRRPDTRVSPYSPQPPEDPRISRRTFLSLFGGVGVTLGAIGLGIYRPWERRTPVVDQKEPQTLEELVAEAKRMEDGFKDKDLSDKRIRERYAKLIAGIVAIDSNGFITRDEIVSTMVWTNSTEEFVRERLKSLRNPAVMEARYRVDAPVTTASTDIRTRRMVVNTKADSYFQQNLDRLKSSVRWNPLKMFRISLFHEFHHLVKTSEDDIIFRTVFQQDSDRIRNKIVEGFRITGEDSGGFPTAFNQIHEATIELIAKSFNEKYFGSYYSDYGDSSLDSLTPIMNSMESVLDATGITIDQVRVLHRESRLKDFLLLLMSKVGGKDSEPEMPRLRFAMTLLTAIERNDKKFIQDFIGMANAFKQKS